MGTRGPKVQPAVIAKIKGTDRKDRYTDDILDIKGIDFIYNELPTPPDDFPPYAVIKWNEKLGQAQKLYGYISYLDLTMFEEYCITYSELRSVRMKIAKPGPDFDYRLWLGHYHKLRASFIQLSREFGFSPSSRTGIKLIQKETIEKKVTFEL